jgi:hypothetical protein
MRIDLSDLDRLTGIAEALERLFWCLMVVAFFAAVLGSHGTGLLLLILGAAAFVVRTGLADFVRSRGETEAPKVVAEAKQAKAKPEAPAPKPAAEPEFTVYRASRRPRRRTNSAI